MLTYGFMLAPPALGMALKTEPTPSILPLKGEVLWRL